jgi:MinD superfamily P-loop ATPase
MKQLVVLSGKGGTGKTSVAAALADLAARELGVVLVDADADAANLGLLLENETVETRPFPGSDVARIDGDLCLACGGCFDVCRFGAVVPGDPFSIDATACEGCAACALECPAAAIRMEPTRAGSEIHARTRLGPLFHGDLLPGQENTGKLVAALRSAGTQAARETGAELVLVDGPPGIGCPVLAACTGADLALLVTEPSLAAHHDLERILETLAHLSIPAVVCLNKADLHPGLAARVRSFLRRRGLPLVGEIPYHPVMRDAVARRLPPTAMGDEALQALLAGIWVRVREALASPVVQPRAEAAR